MDCSLGLSNFDLFGSWFLLVSIARLGVHAFERIVLRGPNYFKLQVLIARLGVHVLGWVSLRGGLVISD